MQWQILTLGKIVQTYDINPTRTQDAKIYVGNKASGMAKVDAECKGERRSKGKTTTRYSGIPDAR
jgi:hypothetical protein